MNITNKIRYKITIPTVLLLILLAIVAAVSSFYLSRMQNLNNDLAERFNEINEVRNIENSAMQILHLFSGNHQGHNQHLRGDYLRHEAEIFDFIEDLESDFQVVNDEERANLDYIRGQMNVVRKEAKLALNQTPINYKKLNLLAELNIQPLVTKLALWYKDEVELVDQVNETSEETLEDYILMMYLMGSAVFLTVIFSMVFYHFLLTRRIISIRDGAHVLGDGDLKHKIVVDGNDELTLVADDINNMAMKIDKYQSELQHIAQTDELTGLYNRHAMKKIISHELSRAERVKSNATVLLLDIDHFKNINDTYGHTTGDKVLQHLSEILKQQSRRGDYVFRFGGEEFLIYLTDCKERYTINTAERFRNAIDSSRFDNEGEDLKVTISIGIAASTTTYDINELIKMADKALYEAKEKGRNCSVLYQGK